MRRFRVVCILACIGAAACSQSGTGVSLTVDAAGLAPDELDVTAQYDGRSVTRNVATHGAAALTLLAELPDENTAVVFGVVARRGGSIVGAAQSGAVSVSAHQIVSVTLTLAGNVNSDGGARDLGGRDLGGDGGMLAWTHQHGALPPTGGAINAMWGSSGSDVYAACSLANNVNLLRSTDHGAHWSAQLANSSAASLNGVGGSSASDVVLVGDGALVLRGAGTTWTASSAPVPAATKLEGVFAVAPGDIYIAGSGNVILHSVTGGWVTQTATGTIELRAVWGVPGHVWAVGSAGTILHSTENGVWSAETSHTGAELRAVFGSGAGDVWAAGDGVLLHSDGSGAWTDASSTVPSGVSLRALGGAPGSSIFATGSGWTILRHDAGGWTIEPSGLAVDDLAGDKLNGVFAPSLGEVFAGGDGQVILHRP